MNRSTSLALPSSSPNASFNFAKSLHGVTSARASSATTVQVSCEGYTMFTHLALDTSTPTTASKKNAQAPRHSQLICLGKE
ncbi:hypothetical protein MY11210_005579 [Beauveria gryllotalpidicola]